MAPWKRDPDPVLDRSEYASHMAWLTARARAGDEEARKTLRGRPYGVDVTPSLRARK